MFCMTASDTLGGIASIASKVDYLIYGFVAGVPTRLASGQLSDSSAILYTAPSAAHVISVSFVNTHTSAVSIDLFLDPLNAGTPRRAIPKTLVLQAGYSLYFDGQRCMMIDTSGGIVSGGNVSDEEYGANWDGVTSVSPSKNAVYDQMQLKLTGSYATAAEIIAGEETAEAIAPDQLKLAGLNLGAWTTPAFDAANFIGNSPMTWTVEAADVITYAYKIENKTSMKISFKLSATTVGGTLSNILLAKIPAENVAAKAMSNKIFLSDNGTPVPAYITSAAGSTWLNIYKDSTGNMSASTNATYCYGELTFEISN